MHIFEPYVAMTSFSCVLPNIPFVFDRSMLRRVHLRPRLSPRWREPERLRLSPRSREPEP